MRPRIWTVTHVYTYVSTYVYPRMLFLSGTPRSLPPRFHGSMARTLRSDLLRRSTPLRTASRSLRPRPRRSSPLPVSTSSLLRVIQCLASLGSFVLSFVRSCYSLRRESSPVFRRLQCATAPLFSSPLSVPIRFLSLFRSRPHPRQDTRALLSFPRLRPFPFPTRRVSTVNRYFRSGAFRLSTAASLSYTSDGYVASLSSYFVLFSNSPAQDVS